MNNEDREGFEKAISDNPGDGTFRLVFADYLEECGHQAEAEWQRWVARTGWKPCKDQSVAEPKVQSWDVWKCRRTDSNFTTGILPVAVWEECGNSKSSTISTFYTYFKEFPCEQYAWNAARDGWIKAWENGFRPEE